MAIQIRELEFCGIPFCLLLSNPDCELLISLSFGPRVLSYRSKNGSNFFCIFKDQIEAFSRIPAAEWHSYGGHRLWAAPESYPARISRQ